MHLSICCEEGLTHQRDSFLTTAVKLILVVVLCSRTADLLTEGYGGLHVVPVLILSYFPPLRRCTIRSYRKDGIESKISNRTLRHFVC